MHCVVRIPQTTVDLEVIGDREFGRAIDRPRLGCDVVDHDPIEERYVDSGVLRWTVRLLLVEVSADRPGQAITERLARKAQLFADLLAVDEHGDAVASP